MSNTGLKTKELHSKTIASCLWIASLFVSNPAFGLGLSTFNTELQPRQIQMFKASGSGVPIDFHSFHSIHSNRSKSGKFLGFNLLKSKSLSFEKGITNFIRNKIENPFIRLRVKNTPTRSFGLTRKPTRETIEYDFLIKNIPICSFQIRAHMYPNGNQLALGDLPNVSAYEPPPSSDWPRIYETLDLAASFLRDSTQPLVLNNSDQDSAPELLSAKKCYSIVHDKLLPTWEIIFHTGGFGYRAIADEYEVLQIEKLAFDVTGTIKVFEKNPISANLKTYQMELTGDTHLTSSFFTTNTNSVDRAQSDTHTFVYDPVDYRFQEASSFAHVALMFDFFRELGYEWQGPKPVDIFLHVVVNSSKNNALYQPAEATKSRRPSISIGDGDGIVLQNLALDSDVVSHEFSHHVIYATLKSITGESLVLHEGLADFFSNSRTNDPCLGESICPANSLACAKKSQCLRTADNTIDFSSEAYNNLEPHLKGQVISGYLWDLREKKSIPPEDVTKLTYEAVQLFVKNSGIRDFLLSLLLADSSKYDGTYCSKIYEAAIERGFEGLLDGISCESDAATWGTPEGINAQPPEEATSKSKNSKNKFFNCGTIHDLDRHNNWIIALFFLLLPIFISRTAQQKVK